MEQVTEVQFKTVGQYVEHLEASEATTLEKSEVIEALKGIVARPAAGQRRGQLAGLTLDQMTDDQLKREIINANSVLYKAQQRGASEETIAKNQARVDAAKAEKDKRTPEAPAAEEAVSPEAEAEVYNETLTEEI